MRLMPSFARSDYCKFGNFHDNFIFANCIKRHSCDVKNLPLGHDLPSSVNDKMISRGFYFQETSHVRSFVKIKPLPKISEFTVPNLSC